MKLGRVVRWLAFGGYAAAIMVGSSGPLPVDLRGPGGLPLDKICHAAEYAGFAFLLLIALAPHFANAPGWSLFVAAVAAAATYGSLDELNQMRIPEREANVTDFVADVSGAVLAGLLWLRLSGRLAGARTGVKAEAAPRRDSFLRAQ